jgi:hypothetical protein
MQMFLRWSIFEQFCETGRCSFCSKTFQPTNNSNDPQWAREKACDKPSEASEMHSQSRNHFLLLSVALDADAEADVVAAAEFEVVGADDEAAVAGGAEASAASV